MLPKHLASKPGCPFSQERVWPEIFFLNYEQLVKSIHQYFRFFAKNVNMVSLELGVVSKNQSLKKIGELYVKKNFHPNFDTFLRDRP